MAMQKSTLVGIFDDPTQAEKAIERLYNAGIPAEQIWYSNNLGSSRGFLARFKSSFSEQERSADVVTNDLMGMGLAQEQARFYAHHYEAGHTIVAVQSSGNTQDALNILRNSGAYGYNQQAASGNTEVTNGVTQQTTIAQTAPTRMGNASGQNMTAQGSSTGMGNTTQRPSGPNMADQRDPSLSGDSVQGTYNQGMAAQRDTAFIDDAAQPTYNQTSGQRSNADADYGRAANDPRPLDTMSTDQTRTTGWRDVQPGEPAFQRSTGESTPAHPNMRREATSDQTTYGGQDVNRNIDANQQGDPGLFGDREQNTDLNQQDDPGLFGDRGQDVQTGSGTRNTERNIHSSPDIRKNIRPDTHRDQEIQSEHDFQGGRATGDESDPDRRGMFDRGI